MNMDEHKHLKEKELEAALLETRKDIAEGNVYDDSVDEHIARIREMMECREMKEIDEVQSRKGTQKTYPLEEVLRENHIDYNKL